MSPERKVVLVTGGAKGIGKAIVESFARDSIVVINCFHSYDEGKRLADHLTRQGAEAVCIRASVENPRQREALFAEIGGAYGGLDVLVNNAAFGRFQEVSGTVADDLRRSYEVNVLSALECSKLAHPLLKARNGGAIVNLTSVGSSLVVANYVGVGTSKAALESATRYLAAEWARDGIRVNAVSGGLIEGEVADLFPDAAGMQSAARYATPFQRLGTAEEIASVVRFLASDDARWVTGQTVVADGGLSLGGAMLASRDEWLERVGARDTIVSASDANDAGFEDGDAAESGEQFVDEPSAVPSDLPAPTSSTDAPTPAVHESSDAIVIVGMGIVTPGASTPEEFWKVLRDGPELLADRNPDRIKAEFFASPNRDDEDKTYQIASGYADSYTPHASLKTELGGDSRRMDFATQWLRHAAMTAVDGVRLGERVGCAIGYTADGNQHLEEAMVVEGFLADLEAVAKESNGVGLTVVERDEARSTLEAEYSLYRSSRGATPFPIDVGLDAVRGLVPGDADVFMVDTACSSSLYALDIAAKGLRDGRFDSALCGGTFAVGPRNAVLFAKLHGLSQSGNLRPLDEKCDGVLFSDGAAALVLKRHQDAMRDGDEILGFVSSIGMSSDGKGKAIYAPSPRGQKLAIERANASGPGSGVDWIVAHATGTPAGDLCEITSILSSAQASGEALITSNKSLVGHTGWAAGIVSVIQVLLSMRNSTILPQHRFAEAPDAYGLAGSGFRIPTVSKRWPAGRSPRRAAVSGFGFGGTNAHLVITDTAEAVAFKVHDPEKDAPVIVAWSADLPGLDSQDQIAEWVRSGTPVASSSFGDLYDPSGLAVRMPPRVLRTIDRTQLIAVRAAQALKSRLGVVWEAHAQDIGVFVGHMGPTRNAMMYARRCHLDLVSSALQARRLQTNFTPEREIALRRRVASGIVPSNEDSFPGIMPNIISARISNVFDTNGPNMGIDVGEASALGAIEIAAQYVRSGEVTIAVAGGIHGNSDPLFSTLTSQVWGERRYNEGGVLFAVTTKSFAEKNKLPILATIAESRRYASQEVPRPSSFGGAEGGFELLRSLLTGQLGETSATVRPGATMSLCLTGLTAESDSTLDRELQTDITRYDRVWSSTGPWSPSTPLVRPGTRIIGHRPDQEEEARALGMEPCGWAQQFDDDLPHVRVIVDLSDVEPSINMDSDAWTRIVVAHDALLRYLQGRREDPRSFGIIVLGGWRDASAHPLSGLFTGFAKSLSLECQETVVRCVLVDTDQLNVGLSAFDYAARNSRGLPTSAFARGLRFEETIVPSADAETSTSDLGPNSIIVATGGAKGVTAEIVEYLARTFGAEIHLIGSSDLEGNLAIANTLDPELLASRVAYIRFARDRSPGASVAEMSAEYEALIAAKRTEATLERLMSHSGRGRVHYHQADVRDRVRIAQVISSIERARRVDLVIHGAGVNRAAGVRTKRSEAFAEVREIKLGGYLNLKSAFAQAPRRWCSFGSLIGLTGQFGETDYAGANDALSAYATAARQQGYDEFCIGWTLWRDVGMGSSDVHHSFFSETRGGVLTQMPTADGVNLFRKELLREKPVASVVHIGSTEARAIGSRAPGLMPSARDAVLDFYIDDINVVGDSGTALRMIDGRDSFLAHHSVAGVGTLPGCFVVELVAEVASRLHPGLRVVGIRDLEFHAFVRLDGPATRAPLKIRAATRPLGRQDVVEVEVVVESEVRSPTGVLLQPAKKYYSATAILSCVEQRAPLHEEWPVADEVQITDPYHVPGARIFLDQEFKSTRETVLHPLGKAARYDVRIPDGRPYGGFLTPVLLLDGLIRLAVLEPLGGGRLPVAAPTRIGYIDLWTEDNDAQLSQRDDIRLFSSPRGLGIEPSSNAEFWAAGGDGRYLVRVGDVEGVVLGYVDEATGETTTEGPQSEGRSIVPAVAL
ncbi:Phthioceranic/hydroxyphthioceranic acid synthase [Microbacterium oxydans]|uniref:SDR family oxidoreductase n=1 Tax=Microbacterium oxydans TaxID=82380 RepID=UPI001DE58ECE|nr:SDR family oxidoreductase [Microbacterium oxydans]CAH0198241.1 Phthioceranic/hydroxyphthioceranic acid synthase [Microbacterium oxydans]